MENNPLIIRKVPLEVLINLLVEIYNKGVNYIDIIGQPGEEEDLVGISYNDDYIENKENKESEAKIKLSDEDLNQLL